MGDGLCEIADWIQHTFPNGTPIATIAHAIRQRAAEAQCRCAAIQAEDPRRHFKGCPLRQELPDAPAK